ERGMVRMAVPKDPVSGILIVDNVAPELAVIPTIRQITEPGVDGVELTLLPPDGKLPDTQNSLTGAGGQAWRELINTEARSTGPKRIRFIYPDGIAALPDWTRVTANVSWAGGQAAAWCIAAPPLLNGDMETLDDGWLRAWGVAPDNAEKHGGRHSLRVDNPDGRFMCLTNLTPIKPLTRYRMSAWIRRHVEGAYVSVALVEYEAGTTLTVLLDLGAGGKQEAWEQCTGEFTSGPNPRSSAIYLYNRNGKGQAWFDDITLEELAP
ncbi:MAG: hypothetical protein HYU66_08200, partial [Armatimonadetes bacterium]|nr:hypothetical protein [Armatimonadota bacterium]